MTTDATPVKSLARLPGEDDLVYWARITTPSKPTLRDAAPEGKGGVELTPGDVAEMRRAAYERLRPAGGKAKR